MYICKYEDDIKRSIDEDIELYRAGGKIIDSILLSSSYYDKMKNQIIDEGILYIKPIRKGTIEVFIYKGIEIIKQCK